VVVVVVVVVLYKESCFVCCVCVFCFTSAYFVMCLIKLLL
jgi:hypothetical protein